MSQLYSNRVSFNNIHPDYINPNYPKHYPTNFFKSLSDYLKKATIANSDLKRSKDKHEDDDNEKNACLKSILKNKDSINFINLNTEVISTDFVKGPEGERKKSLVEMTDEEILQLDKQFANSSKFNNFDKNFKFNYQDDLDYYSFKNNQLNSHNNNIALSSKEKLDNFNYGYPTNSIFTNNSSTLTKRHRLFHPNNNVILIVISNDPISLNALDFYLKKLAKHGDTIIVLSSINIDEKDISTKPKHGTSSSFSNSNINSGTTTSQGLLLTPVHLDDTIYNVSKSYSISYNESSVYLTALSNYIQSRLRPYNYRLSITLELINSTTGNKDFFKDLIDLYHPNYAIISSISPNATLESPPSPSNSKLIKMNSYYLQKPNQTNPSQFPILCIDSVYTSTLTNPFDAANHDDESDDISSIDSCDIAIVDEEDDDEDDEDDSVDPMSSPRITITSTVHTIPKIKSTTIENQPSSKESVSLLSNPIYKKLNPLIDSFLVSSIISKYSLSLSSINSDNSKLSTNRRKSSCDPSSMTPTIQENPGVASNGLPIQRVKSLLPPISPTTSTPSSISTSPTLNYNYNLKKFKSPILDDPSSSSSTSMSIVERYNRRMSMTSSNPSSSTPASSSTATTTTTTNTTTNPNPNLLQLPNGSGQVPRRFSDLPVGGGGGAGSNASHLSPETMQRRKSSSSSSSTSNSGSNSMTNDSSSGMFKKFLRRTSISSTPNTKKK